MSIFGKLFGNKKAKLDERLRQINRTLTKKAKNQAREHKVDFAVEAKRLGYQCGILQKGMLRKQHHPRFFVDVAMRLLCYPPELGFVIAANFSSFAPSLGWNPFGTIMIALGQINHLYMHTQILARTSVLKDVPELFEVMNNKKLRAYKAGQFLAVAILISSLNVKEARKLYQRTAFEDSVKEALDEELAKYDAEIASEIIKK